MKRRVAALAGVGLLALAACGHADPAASGGSGGGGETSAAATEDRHRAEVGALTPRIVLAHDGGVTTLDSTDGEVLDETELNGYVRLNPAGDGRHVMVSAEESFTAYDTGLEATAHGDHFHYYEQDPALTGITLDAPSPGHVVTHGDRAALFADGTGAVTVYDPTSLAEGDLGVVEELTTDAAHHGVAVPLEDGGVLVTQGTEDERHTIQALDADGKVVAQTDDCPGVHGEAAAVPAEDGSDVVSFGCENGPVVYSGGEFHKVAVDGDYQRSGNQKGSEASPIVLADNKVEADPEGGTEHPTSVALIDTRDASMATVDLGSPYWFRSLDRGPDGEALVLTGDGELNILDPESGKILHEVKVAEPWEEPEQWQTPGPMLSVADGTAFVVDPAQQKLTMVDVASGEVYRELDLPVVPNEIQVVTGTASGEYEVGGESHEGHGHEGENADHDDHDHDHDHDHEDEASDGGEA